MHDFHSVNGNWGPWGAYDTCTKTCGRGTQTKYRECNNPAPAHGGDQCEGSLGETRTCNEDACHGEYIASFKQMLDFKEYQNTHALFQLIGDIMS